MSYIEDLDSADRTYSSYREELEFLKEERDALAAQVERLKEAGEELAHLMDGVREGDYQPDSFTNQPMHSALADTPETSLEKLKAKWQAEALDSFIRGAEDEGWETAPLILMHTLKQQRGALRRQAGGDE